MRRAATLVALVTTIGTLAGCTSAGSVTGSTSPRLPPGQAQTQLVDLTMHGFADQSIDADRQCVADLAAQLTDDDAQALVEAYPNGDPKVSASGRAIGDRLLECADRADLLDTLVASLLASAPVSEACLRDILEPLDSAQLAALFRSDDKDTASKAIVDQLLSCRPSTT